MKRAIVLWLDDIFNATVLVLEIENLIDIARLILRASTLNWGSNLDRLSSFIRKCIRLRVPNYKSIGEDDV